MYPSGLFQSLKRFTPGILGGFVCAVAALTVPACEKKRGSPDWPQPAETASPASVTANDSRHAGKSPKNHSPSATIGGTDPASTQGLRFITYNVESWLTMDRVLNHKEVKGAPKLESEKRAVIQLLTRHSPDVVGLCEIGTREDLTEIQASLKAAGLDLAHTHFTGGGDDIRHLGMLSRFPIIRTVTPPHLEFKLNGTSFTMSRGILDATIEAHGKPYRLLGVHLKSRLEVQIADQEALRFNEARLLRQHVDSILKTDANARLIVYGDFNDTRSSASLKTITGDYNSSTSLTAIPAQDKQGHRWTHYWALHDIYTRFDFITVTQGLKHAADFKNSRIIDDPEWMDASDHRPVMAVFN